MKLGWMVFGGGVVVSGIIVWLSTSNWRQDKQIREAQQQYHQQLGLNIFMKKMAMKQFAVQNERLDTAQQFYTGENDVVGWLDVINGPKLIFYAGESYCSKCVEDHVAELQCHKSRIGADNIIMLFDRVYPRDLHLIRSDNPDLDFITLCAKDIQIPLKKEGTPFLFITDENLRLNDVFIPLKSDMDYSANYYNMIIEKYY